MKRTYSALISSAALLAIAACSDSPSNVTGPQVPGLSLNRETNTGHIHIMPTQAQYAFGNASRTSTSTSTGIIYHGGPILPSTNVAAVYWSSSAIYSGQPTPGSSSTSGTSGDASLIGTFLRGLGGSAYFNINTTYYDGSNTHVQNVVNYTQYYANNTNVPSTSASVTDADMLSMLQSAFASGALTYNRNTLYAIFTAGKTNLGGGFGTQYCAYHGSGTVTVNGAATTVLYAAMPYDYAYPSACTSGFATATPSDPGAGYEVNTLGHEIEETTTDQLGNAWFDRRGYENADKCAWTWGATYSVNGGTANMKIGGVDFLVQRNWVNSGSGGCALHL